jgi:flagellar operon protein
VSAPLHNAALVPPGVGPAHRTAPTATPPAGTRPARADAPVQGPSFADVLRTRQAQDACGTQGVTFSRHALQRLQRRGIELDQPALERLGDGVTRAAGKGSRSSVVFLDGTAFVVAVPNRTVLTAVDPEHMREQVFTNIDSAVVA